MKYSSSMWDMWDRLHDVVSSSSSTQVSLEEFVGSVLSSGESGRTVVDLGCGDGRSRDVFRKLAPGIRWIGIDLESSPEVDTRTRIDAEFRTFDGVHLPFADDSIDLVYSAQVLEHVRHPERLLVEVARVLRPGGHFVGSTSHLEPYHSLSYWNFTPWGFRVIAEDAGMRVVSIQAGIDSLTLIWRSILRRPRFLSRFWRVESPLNRVIRGTSRILGSSTARTNVNKLRYCGQFIFDCAKD